MDSKFWLHRRRHEGCHPFHRAGDAAEKPGNNAGFVFETAVQPRNRAPTGALTPKPSLTPTRRATSQLLDPLAEFLPPNGGLSCPAHWLTLLKGDNRAIFAAAARASEATAFLRASQSRASEARAHEVGIHSESSGEGGEISRGASSSNSCRTRKALQG